MKNIKSYTLIFLCTLLALITSKQAAATTGEFSVNAAKQIVRSSNHSCALLKDSSMLCWGSNSFGQLGNGANQGFSSVPVKVVGLTGVSQIALGEDFSCALTEGVNVAAKIKCWGSNHYGQLGDGNGGTFEDKALTPVQVYSRNQLLPFIKEVAAGYQHACAIVGFERKLVCWGLNDHGQLGTVTTEKCNYMEQGEEDSCSLIPVEVPVIKNVQKMMLEGNSTCVVLKGNEESMTCWGEKYKNP